MHMTISEFRTAVRRGPSAWPGGYPVYAVFTDGQFACWNCLKTERRLILEALADPSYRTGWELSHFGIYWEGEPELCANCGAECPSAYGAEVES